MTRPISEPTKPHNSDGEEGLASIAAILRTLRFGNIMLTVHEGKLVQIDITEKRRIAPR